MFLVSMSACEANTSGWENRLLIINLEALGDLIVFTSVLKHYKKRFPEKKIYLLVKKGFGVEEFAVQDSGGIGAEDSREIAI